MLDRALEAIERGFRVIVLHRPVFDEGGAVRCTCGKRECWEKPKSNAGKHPRPLNWYEQATRDPSVVRSWFASDPRANYGIVGGYEHVIIDIDGDAGEQAWAELTAGLSIPETLAVKTGRGRHLYFRSEAASDVKTTTGDDKELGKGLDVRASKNGQVVGPGSKHPSGVVYEWIDPNAPVAELPAALLAKLPRHSRAPSVETRERDWVNEYRVKGIAAGSHQSVLSRVIGRQVGMVARGGGTLDDVEDYVEKWVEHHLRDRDDRALPWALDFARRTWEKDAKKAATDSANGKKGAESTGKNGIPDIADIAAEVVGAREDTGVYDAALEALPAEIYQPFGLGSDGVYRRDLNAGSRTFREILTDPDALAPAVPVIPRLAWAGRVTLFAAREKSGKSTLASAGVAALTRGTKFIDDYADKGTALWVLLEEHVADLSRRALRFRTDPDRLVVRERLGQALLDELARDVASRRPTVLVIDTLHAFGERSGLVTEAISSSQWQPIMRYFAEIARIFDVAVLLLHHGARATGKYRDSTAIGAGVDVIIEMEVPKSNTDPVRVLRTVGRWQTGDVAVRLEGDRYERTAFPKSADVGKLNQNQTKALGTLSEHGKPMTYGEWLAKSGLKETTFGRVVSKLTELGHVEHKGNRYAAKPIEADDAE